MYSDRRYSLARYSANRAERTVEVAECFTASLGASAGAAVPVWFRDHFTETLGCTAIGYMAVPVGLSGGAVLNAAARMSANTPVRSAFADGLLTAVLGVKNTPAGMENSTGLGALTQGSKNLPAWLGLADELSAQIFGSKNINASLPVSEVLTSLLEAISQTTERAVFQLTIPPGGELRIDSELFNVLLNGENALHTQSGDWINVSRELLRVTVESASGGGLEGQIIYTERLL